MPITDLIPIEFSQLVSGGNVQSGDIIVGLRGGLNRKFTFESLVSLTGTANEIVISGTSSAPIVGIADNAILPGSAGVTLPGGNTAARSGGAGTIRFNSQTTELETTLDGATWLTLATTAGTVLSVSGTANRITSTGGANPVIDIAATYVGQTSLVTLGVVTTGTWSATTIATTVGGTGLTSYILGDTLYGSAPNVLSKLSGNTTAVKQYLSQTGTGVVSAAPAWATISGGDITGAALTKVDDINVTLTLGGTPTTCLLRAASLTLGWTGQLGLTRGGTNASLTADNGGIVYSTATALAILAATATAGQIIRSGSNAAPSWSTATYPATTTINQLLYSSSNNVIGGLTSANSAGLVTTSAGVPVFTSSLTDGQLIIGSTGATPVAASLTAGSGVTITPGAGTITISATGSGGTVTSVSGTANRITSTGGTTPVIDIAATYVGQSSITTLGTIGTGVWQGSVIGGTYGGTGVNNGASTITIGGNVTFSGAFTFTGTVTGNTSVTFPTSGTLVNTAVTTLSSLVSVGALSTGSLAAGFTPVTVPIGGTGNTTFTAYSVICAGTTATGAFQNVSGLGSAGQVLTSNGASALPTWESGSGGPSAATQSDQETGTSTTTYVSPGRQQYHASACKCWGVLSYSGGVPTLDLSYNTTSISDDGTALFTITIDVDFSSANYAVVAMEKGTISTNRYYHQRYDNTETAGAIQLEGISTVGVTDSSRVFYAMFGDQ